MSEIKSFNNILIVGLGLIGGSLATALKRKGFSGNILAVDKEEILNKAITRNLIDKSYSQDQLKEAVEEAELIILCTPITEIIELLKVIAPWTKPGTLISDVGSTKRKIVETANIYLPAHCHFIGGHPMAGSEFRGLDAADAFLFENTTYVLTPNRPTQEAIRRAFGELLEFIGAKVLLLSAQLHDEIAAAVSHLPQVTSVGLMNLVNDRQNESSYFLKMAAGGFRDMTRVSSSPYGIWEDIIETNNDMIAKFLNDYIRELEHLKHLLLENNLGKYFERAARARLSIPKDTKGFLKPHYDVSVSVEDKPGMIAGITRILSKEQINIKDIEVLKIRENEGGTIRLAFASENDRERAIGFLIQNGYECRKRE
jgi:prephenate dehydrogenase